MKFGLTGGDLYHFYTSAAGLPSMSKGTCCLASNFFPRTNNKQK
jgi:hypothetical protein